MNKETLEEEYNSKLACYEALKEEAHFILKTILDESNIKIHLTLSRIKEFVSFYDKVERKEILHPFKEITDIVGLRVVCLFLSDIERIGDKIREAFIVLSEDNKINGYDDLTSFGYMSFHFIVKMKQEYNGPRYERIKDLSFEIQVRTISMDAWANISHYLSYKTEADVPKELKRDFYALSGLFYVGDTHFELFYNESKKSQKILQHRVEGILSNKEHCVDEEINLDSLKAYLYMKLPNRKRCNNKSISDLITELMSIGIYKISELENLYKKAWETFLENEKENPPLGGGLFANAGVIRGLLDLAREDYRTKYNRAVDERFIIS